jgi:hypothetical protein
LENNYNSLSYSNRRLVLQWIRESINDGIERNIKQRSYRHFVHCLNTGQDFNPADIWNNLPDYCRDHFNHSRIFIEKIDKLLMSESE